MSAVETLLAKRTALRRGLLRWYDREARDLPWRRTSDPYHVWVSEIMLQQTQVATVEPYYGRFLAAFPTVEALAAAEPDAVLKQWEGLGYYRRAKNLHKAAGVVVAELEGRLPRTAAGWRALPGIGRYTAAAIASIAFGEAAAVLDGNVKRVLARTLAIRESIDLPATEAELWQAAEAMVTAHRPGDVNQAMMELGARVCTPRAPQCLTCCVRNVCDAAAAGLQEVLPVRTKKSATPHYEVVAAAIRRHNRYLMGRRPDDAMLGGLWEFPGGKLADGETHAEGLRRELLEETGLTVEVGPRLATVEHAYTHFSITLHLYLCNAPDGQPHPHWHTRLRWVCPCEFDDFAMPGATRKLLEACDLRNPAPPA
ncbi:MAG: A/G-specific adenine glycosylase [Planctomycetes bacterium]|nr:A/G-specific adenine glycosylase [Planctomycetota bacterium]